MRGMRATVSCKTATLSYVTVHISQKWCSSSTPILLAFHVIIHIVSPSVGFVYECELPLLHS